MIPKSCRLFGQDHAKSHDPEKLQAFRTRSCAKLKKIVGVPGSTLSKNALEDGGCLKEGCGAMKWTSSLGAAAVLVLAGAAALAQDFTAGKTPAQLFGSDCSECHRSPA